MKNFKLLESKYPSKKIELTEIYRIDEELLFTKKELSKQMGVTTRTLNGWVNDGLEPSIYSIDKLLLFNFSDVENWRAENKQTHKGNSDEDDEATYDGVKITEKNRMLAKEIESARNEQIKRKQSELQLLVEEGKYIPSETADKSSADIIKILLSGLHNVKNTSAQRILDGIRGELSLKSVKDALDDEFESLIETIKIELDRYGGSD